VPLQTNLTLDILNGTEQLTGSVTAGGSVSAIVAERAAFDATKSPAPQAGTYTFLSKIPHLNEAAAAVPQGFGFGTLSVSKAGGVRTLLTLGDGSKVTATAALSKTGSWPLYTPLYGGDGFVLGRLLFESETAPEMNGTLHWVKPKVASDALYPSGFSTALDSEASAYVPPPPQTRIIPLPESTPNLLVQFGGGNLSALPSQRLVTLDIQNRVIVPAGEGLTLSITPSRGEFTGSFLEPATRTLRRFSGVIQQRPGFGAGTFHGNGQTGWITISPIGGAVSNP
jgi:hypothetical protein